MDESSRPLHQSEVRMMRKHVVLSALIAFLSLVVSGCSSSPTSPSSTSASVTLHGTAVGPSAASTSSAGGLQAMSVPSAGRVTVTVLEKPSITTTTVVLVKVEINGTDTTDATKTCLINGGRVTEGIELEGSVGLVTGTSSF